MSYFADVSQVIQSVSQSVLALRPSVILDQILAEVRQLRGCCHMASSLTGRRVSSLLDPLLESSLDPLWSLFAQPCTGVFLSESSETEFEVLATESQSVLPSWP
jgi:hypothetical protein